MATQAVELLVLDKATLEAAQKACARVATAGREQAQAKKDADAALGQVFFEMGFTGLDEVKAMPPDELMAEITKRTGKLFTIEAGAEGLFVVQKTHEGRYPKWKEELVLRVGPSAARAIEDETATQYSYTVVEAAKAKPGSGALLLGSPRKPARKS